MGLGLGWPVWKDIQEGEGAERATKDTGSDMEEDGWMTLQFLIWVRGGSSVTG